MNFGFADHRSEGNAVLSRPLRIGGGDRLESFGSLQTFDSNKAKDVAFSGKGSIISTAKSLTAKSEKLGVVSGGFNKNQYKGIKIGSDFLDLVSKRSFNPVTIEPASDVSFSCASSVLSFGQESTDSFATKSETSFCEQEASREDIAQELEHLDDTSMNADSSLANDFPAEIYDDSNRLDVTASNKTALLQRKHQGPASEISLPKSECGDSEIQSKDVLESIEMESPDPIERYVRSGSNGTAQDTSLGGIASTSGELDDDGSYLFEDLVVMIPLENTDRRRSSARSLGSTRSGLTELDVTAHTRYNDATMDEIDSIFPNEDLATDVLSTRSGMTDLDTTAHRSSFVAQKLDAGELLDNSSDDDPAEDSSANGSDNSSLAALQELMDILGKDADQDISGHDESESPEWRIEDEEPTNELQELMNIMDRSDATNLRMSTVRLNDNSFVKNIINMDGSDLGEQREESSYGVGSERKGEWPLHSKEADGDENEGRKGGWPLLSKKDGGKEYEDTYSPNRPHPALEYPPLYFLLRRFPWLFDKIKMFYILRWRLSYPLQRRLPYSRTLRKVGVHLTWGELLLLLPFFTMLTVGIVYTFVIPSVAVSGKVARFGLIGALLFAQRNSIVTLLIGMPLDRSIFYHKLSGRLAGLTGLMHTLAFFLDPVFRMKHKGDALGGGFDTHVNASGSMIMILMVGIIASSIKRVRHRLFEVFYYLHLFFAVGMIVSAYFHSGILIPCLAGAIWGVDLFVRSIVMARTRYPRKATLNIISDTVIEVSFPKTAGFCYNPGQYIYLSIPDISWLQWHPFSISSSPKQKTVTLHIRVAGQWTSDLYQLARKGKEVSMLLEGPYGNVGVDILTDRKYKRIMLISGGIGMTPMQSVCEQLLYEKAKERRELESLKFIWIERDPILMEETEFIRRSSSIGSIGSLEIDDYLSSEGSLGMDDTDMEESPGEGNVFLNRQSSKVNEQLEQFIEADQNLNIASQLLALLPSDKTTDEELDDMFGSQHLDMSQCLDGDLLLEDDGDEPLVEEEPVQNTEPEAIRRPSILSLGSIVDDETSFAENSASWVMEAQPVANLANVLDLQVYLTGKTPTISGVPFARTGRPDIKALFQEEKKAAILTNQKKVAVLVSAPIKVQELCRKACLLYSDDRVRFDFHSECMGM